MKNNSNSKILASSKKTTLLQTGERIYLINNKNQAGTEVTTSNKKIINAIIEVIKSTKLKFTYNSNKHTFTITNRENKLQYSLGQLILGKYYNVPLNKNRIGRVMNIDKDRSNCSLDNLYSFKFSTPETRSIKLWHDEKRIYLLDKKTGDTAYTDYTADLFKVLKSPHLTWRYNYISRLFQANKRYGADKKDTRFSVSLHQVIIAYLYNNLTPNNLIGNIKAMQKNFKELGLEIDHLNTNRFNDMPYNIVPMLESFNRAKYDLVAKVQFPYFCIPVFADGEYRVAIGSEVEDDYNIECYSFKNEQSFVPFIQDFYNSSNLLDFTPKENFENNFKEKSLTELLENQQQFQNDFIIDKLLKADNLKEFISTKTA